MESLSMRVLWNIVVGYLFTPDDRFMFSTENGVIWSLARVIPKGGACFLTTRSSRAFGRGKSGFFWSPGLLDLKALTNIERDSWSCFWGNSGRAFSSPTMDLSRLA